MSGPTIPQAAQILPPATTPGLLWRQTSSAWNQEPPPHRHTGVIDAPSAAPGRRRSLPAAPLFEGLALLAMIALMGGLHL